MSERRDTEMVDRLQRWLRQVMATREPPISAEAWGAKAGVSPTNITRFLKHGYPVPKTRTLALLAEAVGLPPPDQALALNPVALVEVPIILGSIWHKAGLSEAMGCSVETTLVPRHHVGAVALRVNTSHGNLAGVLAGDLVIVNPRLLPKAGDLVAWAALDGSVSVLRCEPPVLRAPSVGSSPLEVPENDPGMVGVVVQLQRDLITPNAAQK